MRSIFSALALLIVVSASAARAEIVPPADLAALVAQSDAVVVGRVEGATYVGPQAESLVFRIAVDRIIKGALGPVRRVSVRLDVSEPVYPGVADREYAMFFLRRSGNILTATDPYYPAVVAAPERRAGPASPQEAEAAVAAELANVLGSEARLLLDPENGVGDLAIAPPAQQAEAVYFEAARALSSLPYSAVSNHVEALAASGSVSARLWALYSLAQIKGPAERDALAARLLGDSVANLVAAVPRHEFVIQVLASAIKAKLGTPAAVPALSALLRSKSVSVRRAAASALAQVGTADVIRPLADIALNDPDTEVRYFAVFGLSAATGAHDAPAMAAFAEQETQHLSRSRSRAAGFR